MNTYSYASWMSLPGGIHHIADISWHHNQLWTLAIPFVGLNIRSRQRFFRQIHCTTQQDLVHQSATRWKLWPDVGSSCFNLFHEILKSTSSMWWISEDPQPLCLQRIGYDAHYYSGGWTWPGHPSKDSHSIVTARVAIGRDMQTCNSQCDEPAQRKMRAGCDPKGDHKGRPHQPSAIWLKYLERFDF